METVPRHSPARQSACKANGPATSGGAVYLFRVMNVWVSDVRFRATPPGDYLAIGTGRSKERAARGLRPSACKFIEVSNLGSCFGIYGRGADCLHERLSVCGRPFRST